MGAQGCQLAEEGRIFCLFSRGFWGCYLLPSSLHMLSLYFKETGHFSPGQLASPVGGGDSPA